MKTALLAALALTLSSISINVNGLEVDGQRVSALECELESGGFLASAIVASSLSQQKTALDACAPAGGAYEATWTWGAGATVDVLRGEPAEGVGCIKKALEAVESDLNGTCKATILVGDPAGADAALTRLSAQRASPDEKTD